MAELATRAQDAEQTERERLEELRQLGLTSASETPPAATVEGRVFQRLYRYHLLPVQLQLLSDAVAVYLVSTPDVRERVFGSGASKRWRHPTTVGPCVRGQKLLETIQQYLVESQGLVDDDVQNRSDVGDSARQIADALVLSGFISPVHDLANEDNIATYVHARESYELVAPGAMHVLGCDGGTQRSQSQGHAYEKKSVWGVADGATRAGFVFRKLDTAKTRGWRSIVAKCLLCGADSTNIVGSSSSKGGSRCHETKQYAVINKTQFHALFLFATDVARQELYHVDLRQARVHYESGTLHAPLYHGLKVWTTTATTTTSDADARAEMLDFVTQQRQEDWLIALLDAGATYVESNPAFAHWASPHASFYALTDNDADGEVFQFRSLVHKVVLLVSVACKDPEAPRQFPELAALDRKYRDEGLVVLAFPSEQFGVVGEEFDTDSDIAAFTKQAYDVEFQMLGLRDMNGPNARPAFLFLNAHLPGRFGPFTEWTFTKFLVDRHGKPVKRYDTHVLPLNGAIERDICVLLREDGSDYSGDEVSADAAPDDGTPEETAARAS